MLNSITNELSRAKILNGKSKFREALQIVNDIEKKQGITAQEQFEIFYLKSSLLVELGYMNKALNYINLAYEKSQLLKDDLQIFNVLISKSNVLFRCIRPTEALKTITEAEQLLNKINRSSSMEYKENYASLILQKGRYHLSMGYLNRSLEYANEVLTIAEEIENDVLKLYATKLFVFNYGLKGDYEQTLETSKRYLVLAKKSNNKQEIIGAFNSVGMVLTEKEEFDQALDYLKQGLSICDEINSFKKAAVLSSLFGLYLEINSLNKAQQCLDRIKQIRNQEYSKWLDDLYRLGKAEVLKKKPQNINHSKAKEIFKQIVDEEGTFIEFNYSSLIHLCDSYLTELSKTNDLKILDEIQPYITRLMNIAKLQKSYWLLVEGYSFQAKLKLIIFEFREAQNYLTQALNIAKKYGQNRLVKRILNEQDELSNNFIKWEKLKASRAGISERMDLARIDEQIEILLQKRRYLKKINGQ